MLSCMGSTVTWVTKDSRARSMGKPRPYMKWVLVVWGTHDGCLVPRGSLANPTFLFHMDAPSCITVHSNWAHMRWRNLGANIIERRHVTPLGRLGVTSRKRWIGASFPWEQPGDKDFKNDQLSPCDFAYWERHQIKTLSNLTASGTEPRMDTYSYLGHSPPPTQDTEVSSGMRSRWQRKTTLPRHWWGLYS